MARSKAKTLLIDPQERKGGRTLHKPKRKAIMISEELHEELSELAYQEDVTYAVLMRALLDFYKQNATA